MHINLKLRHLRNLVVYTVIVSMLLISSGAATADSIPAPVQEAEESVVAGALLDALGIQNSIPAEAKKIVTNGEFAKTLLSVIGYDVADGQEAVAAAKELKIILDAKIDDKDELKWTTAMQMGVSVTGYNAKIVAQGSGVEGYYTLAAVLGLNQGVSAKRGDSLNAQDARMVLYRIMHTDIMQQNFDGINTNYTADKGVTLLSKLYDITTVKDIVTAVDYTSLYTEEKSAGDHHIKIGKTTYEYEDAQSLRRYLGYHVEAYVGGKDGDQLYYLYKTKNQEISMVKDDVTKMENGRLYYYDEANRTKNIHLADAYDVLYNGKPYGGSDWLELSGKGASIQVIDNDRDGQYEVAAVWDPVYMLVSAVDLIEGVLYGSEAERIDIANPGTELQITDAKTQSPATINEISQGTLIKAIVSKDGTYLELTLYTDSLQGQVTACSAEMDFITIDSNQYSVDPYFKEHSTVIPQRGRSYTFWLSDSGTVVRMENATSVMRYGYVINVYTAEEDGGECVRLLDQSGKIMELRFKDKLVLDDESVSSSVAANAVRTPQLIRYRSNSEEITTLDTAAYSMDYVDPDSSNDRNNLTGFNSNESLQYKNSSKMFATAYSAGSAIVFVVPNPDENKSKEYYKVSNSAAFSNDQSYQQGTQVTAYNINEERNAEAIVYYNSTGVTSTYNNETESAIVERLEQGVNEDSELCYYMTYVMNNQFTKIMVDPEVSLLKASGKMIDTGDVIRFSTEDGKIKSLSVDFDAEYGKMDKDANSDAGFNGTSQILQFHYGMIYSLNGSSILLTQPEIKDTSDETAFQWKNTRLLSIPSGTAMLVERTWIKNQDGSYSITRENIRRVEPSEIITYKNGGTAADFALVRQRYMEAKSFIIYRNLVS